MALERRRAPRSLLCGSRPGRPPRAEPPSPRERGRASRRGGRPCSRRGCRATSPRSRACWPSFRIESESIPFSSASATADSRIRSRLRGFLVVAIDIAYAVCVPYGVNLRRMEEKMMMKALVRHKFGGPDVVHIEEVEQPGARGRPRPRPRPRELDQQVRLARAAADARALVRPSCAAACCRPKNPLLGADFAGRRRGRREGRDRPRARRRGIRRRRRRLRRVRRREDSLVRSPPTSRSRRLRTIGIAGLTALQGLRDNGGLKPGERVLDQRRLGRSRDDGDPDRQGARRHVTAVCRAAQPRAGRPARRRPCHRPHAGELHTGQRAVTTSSSTSPAATHMPGCAARCRPEAASS